MVSTSTKPEPDKPTTQVPDKPDEPARAPSRSAETTIDRGKIVRGHALVHTFVIPNDDQTDLVIEKVKPSGSGTVDRFDEVIKPSKQGEIHVSIDTNRAKGPFRDRFMVSFRGRAKQLRLELKGRIVPPLEWNPKKRIYFFGVHGHKQQKEVTLINHRDEDLPVTRVASSSSMFKASLETIKQGREYRVTIDLPAEVPPGKHEGTIDLLPAQGDTPLAAVDVRAILDAVVSAHPSPTDFGLIRISDLHHKAIGEKTVTVKKYQGSDFRVVDARTDLPFVFVNVTEREPGKTFAVTLKMLKDRVKPGEVSGTLVVKTNDPEFSELKVPIIGTLLAALPKAPPTPKSKQGPAQK